MLTQLQKDLLQHDKEQNIALLYLDQEYPLLGVMESGGMMMCRYLSEEEWCHFSYNSTPEFIDKFFAVNPKSQYIVVSDDKVYQEVCKRHRVKWSITCYRLFLKGVISTRSNLPLAPVQSEHLKIIFDNSKYQQFLSLNYLTKRLLLGGGYCVLNNNKPVGWMMTHDDGSIGNLHILDSYRRKGYARKLIEAMSTQVMMEGREVYAHIEPSNIASLNLFQSLGFKIRGKVTWALFS